MRFLFVGNFGTKGGSAMATIPLVLKLKAKGHEISFAHWILPAQIELFTKAGLLNLSLHEQRSLFSKIIYLTRVAFAYDALVAVSELTITYACQIAGWLSRRPVCGELQVNLDAWIESNSSRVHYQLSRWFYPNLQALRCVSQGLAQFAVAKLRVPLERIFITYNPFDLQEIGELSKGSLPKEARDWFRVPVIICAGRLDRQKRFDLAIAAFSIIKSKLREPINLVILGEGQEKSELQQQIDRLKLQDSVCLAGFYDNPYPFFANAHAFLLCSDYEGFGRVIVDAMASGCPVVANDCPFGPAEILNEGEFGLLFPNNNPETIAETIITLWKNPDLRSGLIQKGYRRCQDFSVEAVCDRYINALENMISKSSNVKSN